MCIFSRIDTYELSRLKGDNASIASTASNSARNDLEYLRKVIPIFTFAHGLYLPKKIRLAWLYRQLRAVFFSRGHYKLRHGVRQDPGLLLLIITTTISGVSRLLAMVLEKSYGNPFKDDRVGQFDA